MKNKSKLEGTEGKRVEWENTEIISEIFLKLKNEEKNIEVDKFKKWMGKMKISGILVTEEE